MKKNLVQNIKVIPGGVGTVIDRAGFLSAIVGALVTVAGIISIAVSHCDTETGTFEAVTDKRVIIGDNNITVAVGDIANIDIDLTGCKRFVKFTASGATATYAVALGDADFMPV